MNLPGAAAVTGSLLLTRFENNKNIFIIYFLGSSSIYWGP